MKVSVVISIKNRTKLFKRALKLWQKQTMPAKDFELVIIDDLSEEDVKLTLQVCAGQMNVKYIKVDSQKNDFPVYWGPAISNNVGFRAAEGEVIMITGPEILHKETNLDIAYEAAQKDQFPFGHVYHSGPGLVFQMDRNIKHHDLPFDQIMTLPQARVRDITHDTFYWFICAVKKAHVMEIGGCDEEYMKGICGDDDDFANRIDALGVKKVHDFRMVGIHQDHSIEDRLDPKRRRKSPAWEQARMRNTKYLDDWYTARQKTPYANKGRDWGSERVVLHREQVHRV